MFCDRCGANLQGPVSFCPHCGRQFGAASPPLPVINRVAGHVRNLAIIWIVYSAIRILPGFFFGSIANWDWPFYRDAPFFVRDVVRGVSGFLILGGALGIIAGWGLYERRHWARMLAIVLGFLSLLHPPFGTAIGIYTLWVLLPAASEAEWQRVARP